MTAAALRLTAPKGPGETQQAPASRLANTLERRDFIDIVLALSLFGKANWFLVPTSVGAPAYFFLVAALARRRPERTAT
jgi:hypothetical protein